MNCSISLLFFAEMSGTQFGLQLLQLFYFKIQYVVCLEMLLCIESELHSLVVVVICVTVAFLSHPTSLSSVLWHQQGIFVHNCHLLDILSF